MKPATNIGYLLNHLSFVLNRQSDQVLQERLGIGFSQFKILTTLQRQPNIQQKQIAERLGQTEASVSRQIKLLLSQGLLQSMRNPHNRREHITTLTNKGERFTVEATDILNTYHQPVYQVLTEKQAAALISSLTIMHQQTCTGDRSGACHQVFSDPQN